MLDTLPSNGVRSKCCTSEKNSTSLNNKQVNNPRMQSAGCGCSSNHTNGKNTSSNGPRLGLQKTLDVLQIPPVVTCISSLQFHIRVLYAIITCLTLLLVSSLVVVYLEISSLREEMSHVLTMEDIVDVKFPVRRALANDDHLMPYLSEDELNLEELWGEEEHETRTGTSNRKKRHAFHHEGSGTADDWTWMSSFARVPLVALKNYCRESQTYCAAEGPAGPPGVPGEKGDAGEKGDKGDYPDEAAIAMNLANLESVRGPPGPKGEKGQDGPRGPKGDIGPPGIPGEDGIDGYPGPRGAKGEPGMRGLLGFPGLKGSPGPTGSQGPKGEKGDPGRPGMNGVPGSKGSRGLPGPKGARGMSGLPGVPGMKGLKGDEGPRGPTGPQGRQGPRGDHGYCEVQCVDTKETRESIEVTTPAPTFPPRMGECRIKVIGKPVFLRQSTVKKGAWMKDTSPPSAYYSSRIWATYGLQGEKLVEYRSMDAFKSNTSTRQLDLGGTPYFGTGHIVYRGHFYYHWEDQPKIVKYSLALGEVTTVRIVEDVVYKPTKALKWQGYLYQSEAMFIDFNVDKNGLWIIYGNKKTEKVMVALLDTENLDVIKAVEVDLELGSKGNAFMACGKLYTLRHHSRKRSYIDEEHDLWTGKSRKVRISFSNPYAGTVMVTYDYQSNKILAWDNGNQLSSPLLLKF